MGVIGHKERALMRRGLYVQEALKRRDIINEYVNKRRLVKEEEYSDEFDSIDSIKVDTLCAERLKKDKGSFWCELKNYVDNSQLPEERIKQLYNYITLIKTSLRPVKTNPKNEKEVLPSIDNKRVMGRIGVTILKHPDPLSVFKMLAEWLENPVEIDENGKERLLTRKEFVDKLKVFNDENTQLSTDEIEKFLKKVRNVEYTLYEKSFVSNNFSRNSGYIQLPVGHNNLKIQEVLNTITTNIESYNVNGNNLSNVKYINNIDSDSPTISNATTKILNAISQTDPKIFKNKADLTVKNNLTYQDKVVVPKDSLVEVKMLNYSKDSYFSEFFAIYKNEENLNDLKFLVYRDIIMGLYRGLNNTDLGDRVLRDIQEGVSAMIFDDELLVEEKYIELYWSTTGARDCTKEPRLSIRYRINSKDVVFYKYDRKTHSNQLTIVNKPPFNLPERKQLCN